VFPNPELLNNLKQTNRLSITKYTIPDFGSNYKVSIPISNILYKYSQNKVFPK
ncbi:uncharacterized protein K444DRAFT_519413, partial [Hyaloscypha bicolor E]